MAGIAKLRDPEPAVIALAGAGLPARRWLVVIMGLGEATLGAAAATTGAGLLAGAVACAYLAFAAFIVRSLRRGDARRSCGCFGRSATPPAPAHVILNAGGAVAAAAAAAGPTAPLTSVLGHQPLFGVPFGLLTLVAAYAAHLAFLYPPRHRPWNPT